jgi:hypothetical protein
MSVTSTNPSMVHVQCRGEHEEEQSHKPLRGEPVGLVDLGWSLLHRSGCARHTGVVPHIGAVAEDHLTAQQRGGAILSINGAR